jgi:HK97 family phage portal protein
MGFLTRVRQPDRLHAASTLQRHIDDFFAGNDLNAARLSAAGISINPDLALTLSAFWQGLRILSENIASFPCHVFEHLPNDAGTKIARFHPIDRLLSQRPNPWQNAFEYWEMTVAHLIMRGNMYSWIVPGPTQPVGQLVPIHPDLVRVQLLPSGDVQYTISTRNGQVRKGAEDIFHIKGLSFNGYEGVSVITYATQDVGGMVAAERHAHHFFEEGATTPVVIFPDAPISPDRYDSAAREIRGAMTGLKNAGGVYLSPDKGTLANVGFKPEDAQLLATREITPRHVSGWLNMHPSLLGDAATVNYASTKQFRQNLNDLTFRPLVERLEAAIDGDLFLNPERFFSRFDMDELKRGDAHEQAQIQHLNITDGVWTRNEGRRRQGMNPLPGLDQPLAQLNMGAVALSAPQLIALRAAQAVVAKEVAEVQALAQEHAHDAEGWQAGLRAFYTGFAGEIAERLRISLPQARAHAARQGAAVSAQGVGACADWEWTVAPALANLALCRDTTGREAALEETAA